MYIHEEDVGAVQEVVVAEYIHQLDECEQCGDDEVGRSDPEERAYAIREGRRERVRNVFKLLEARALSKTCEEEDRNKTMTM